MSVTASAQPETRLTGRRLSLARGVWIVVVALELGLYLFSIPLQLAYYQIVCSGAACPADTSKYHKSYASKNSTSTSI
jgi:hypothetical protein